MAGAHWRILAATALFDTSTHQVSPSMGPALSCAHSKGGSTRCSDWSRACDSRDRALSCARLVLCSTARSTVSARPRMEGREACGARLYPSAR